MTKIYQQFYFIFLGVSFKASSPRQGHPIEEEMLSFCPTSDMVGATLNFFLFSTYHIYSFPSLIAKHNHYRKTINYLGVSFKISPLTTARYPIEEDCPLLSNFRRGRRRPHIYNILLCSKIQKFKNSKNHKS